MNKLTIVGTPIGNLEDISIRALKTLFEAEIVVAEDTRNFLKLISLLQERFPEVLKSLNLERKTYDLLISYREQVHQRIFPQILDIINSGKRVVFTTDAGMPLISDPGFLLVKELINHGVEIDVVPGATAVDTALVLSGMPSDKFVFVGFLPRERGKIKKVIGSFEETGVSIVFYESPFRVLKTLEILAELYPQSQICATNDLTKKFERIYRGSITEVLQQLKNTKIVGEWTLVFGNK